MCDRLLVHVIGPPTPDQTVPELGRDKLFITEATKM
jgi:hypothetical protein